MVFIVKSKSSEYVVNKSQSNLIPAQLINISILVNIFVTKSINVLICPSFSKSTCNTIAFIKLFFLQIFLTETTSWHANITFAFWFKK